MKRRFSEFSQNNEQVQLHYKVKKRNLEGDPLYPVVNRVLLWMSENIENLPKTMEQLFPIISSLCDFTSKIDTKVVYYHLLLNNVIQLDSSGLYHHNQNKNYTLNGFILSEIENLNGFSTEFCEALERTVQTIENYQRSLTEQEIYNIIQVNCVLRRFSPTLQVINYLVNKEVVIFKENSVHYELPPIQRSYYMPVCV